MPRPVARPTCWSDTQHHAAGHATTAGCAGARQVCRGRAAPHLWCLPPLPEPQCLLRPRRRQLFPPRVRQLSPARLPRLLGRRTSRCRAGAGTAEATAGRLTSGGPSPEPGAPPGAAGTPHAGWRTTHAWGPSAGSETGRSPRCGQGQSPRLACGVPAGTARCPAARLHGSTHTWAARLGHHRSHRCRARRRQTNHRRRGRRHGRRRQTSPTGRPCRLALLASSPAPWRPREAVEMRLPRHPASV